MWILSFCTIIGGSQIYGQQEPQILGKNIEHYNLNPNRDHDGSSFNGIVSEF